jgi:hypothetical protein
MSMKSKNVSAHGHQSLKISSFYIIIFTALAAQLLGHYHATFLMIGNYFYLSWLLLRIVVPIAVLLLLRVPLSEIGLGPPRMDGTTRKIVLVAAVLVVVAFIGIYFLKGYFNFYTNAFAEPGGGKTGQFVNFMIFTSSTLTGWEFLHRGFLLMGIVYVLTSRDKLQRETSIMIAVAAVWVFDVMFHFLKPELEALGFLVGSPLLSWLALRTGSIWLPFLFHLLVEVLFISALIMQ